MLQTFDWYCTWVNFERDIKKTRQAHHFNPPNQSLIKVIFARTQYLICHGRPYKTQGQTHPAQQSFQWKDF